MVWLLSAAAKALAAQGQSERLSQMDPLRDGERVLLPRRAIFELELRLISDLLTSLSILMFTTGIDVMSGAAFGNA